MADHALTWELYYDGAWQTAPVLTGDSVTIMRGVKTPGNDTDPAEAGGTFDNTSGMYAPKSALSALRGKIGQNTPGRISLDGDVRITGEMVSWAPQRPIKGSGTTPVVLAGILRRLGIGNNPIAPAAQRAATKAGAAQYVPITETDGATAAADIIGTAPLAVLGSPDMAKVAGPDFATQHAELVRDSTYIGSFSGVNATTTLTGWTREFWFRCVAPAGDASVVVASWHTTGTYGANFWVCWIDRSGSTERVGVYADHDAFSISGLLRSGVTIFDGSWHHVRVTLNQDTATTITRRFYFDGVLSDFGSSGTYTAGRLLDFTAGNYDGRIRNINYPIVNVTSLSVAHVASWPSYEPDDTSAAGDGYQGETAADRFSRFCLEEGITATVVGTAAESVAMGPQQPATRLEILDEIARTDDASIFETKSALGLTMRTGGSKINQTAALTVSYIGQLVPPVRPVFGDKGIRNDVTARDRLGASRQVQQLTGPKNVQLPVDDPQGVGRYDTGIDVNTSSLGDLAGAAGWRVNLGTFDGTWYASVEVDLDAAPGIKTLVNAVDIGQRVDITELPVEDTLAAFSGLVIGIEDRAPAKRRTVVFYLAPYDPYRAGIMAATSGDTDPLVGYAESDFAVVPVAAAALASTFLLCAQGPWTTVADDFEQDIMVGGQRITLASVDSNVRDTFTRSASSGWGTPDFGGAWAVGNGTASLFSATGSAGQIAISSLNVEHYIWLDAGAATVQRIRIYQTLAVTPTGAGINWGGVLRRQDTSNFFWIDVQVGTDSSLTIRVISKVGGSNALLTTQVSGTLHSTSVPRILVAEIDADNIIRAKVYSSSAALEPDWELTYDASAVALTTGTGVGCIARVMTGNTNAAPVNLLFDNFAVLTPQLATVSTGASARKVTYPILAGDVVSVYQPIIPTL